MQTEVLHRKIIHKVEQSFSYSNDTPFSYPLHCHDEYELIYITSGSGKEFIGDSVKYYSTGDLILIGNNVPHLHLCDSVIGNFETEPSFCEILQFPRSLFPENMSTLHEYSFIDLLLDESSQGVKFNSKNVIEGALKIMRKINNKHGIERVIALYKILELLGKSKDTTLVSSVKYSPEQHSYGNEPINRAHNYLIVHFKKDITLKGISDYVSMSPAALCRYFKQRTEKTIFKFLNEVRIEHSCKLLAHSNLTISQIAYEVGYNNLSHFNKQFKGITKQTPTEYKEHLTIKVG